ncbi:2-phospho-L-lactate guanylyltransferase [Nocardia sp. CNY236]|uniref:2-phospho-L-lactate guanylyltransferase n=1 Tax=Nocardia sp. CNY236 TaxID=1169152 RepID=UPI00041610F9|nr:2-phospho-L-lactate guanylyltransferase [Nocardia sp. CNY236]
MRSHAVHAVIAVKSLDRAKSRLSHSLSPQHRARLVLAMLTDTVRAATAVEEIVAVTVVTPDPTVAELARTLGAEVYPEPSGTDADGLNTALAATATAVRLAHGPTDLLALQADLPAMQPEQLSDMLATAPRGLRSVVVDHTGRGTAALVVRDPLAPLAPRFGPGSAHSHIAAGAVDLSGDWPGLRLDVDTAADLDRVLALGAGSATAAVLHDIGWPPRVHANVH